MVKLTKEDFIKVGNDRYILRSSNAYYVNEATMNLMINNTKPAEKVKHEQPVKSDAIKKTTSIKE